MSLTAFLLVAGLSQVLDAVRLNQGKPSLFRTDWALKYFQAGVERRSIQLLLPDRRALLPGQGSLCGCASISRYWILSRPGSYFEGATYLFFFNLGVILPIIILGSFIALGMSPEQVDNFRKDHRVGMRLVTGLMLLALAPLIYWQLI